MYLCMAAVKWTTGNNGTPQTSEHVTVNYTLARPLLMKWLWNLLKSLCPFQATAADNEEYSLSYIFGFCDLKAKPVKRSYADVFTLCHALSVHQPHVWRLVLQRHMLLMA